MQLKFTNYFIFKLTNAGSVKTSIKQTAENVLLLLFFSQVSRDSRFGHGKHHITSDTCRTGCFFPLRYPGLRPVEDWASSPPKPGGL